MSPLAWALLALAVLLLIAATAAVIVVGNRRLLAQIGVDLHEVAEDVYVARTPRGKATARLIVHDEHGRVYEVTTRFRGEGERVTHVPPTPHMIRMHLAGRVAG